MKSCLNKTWPTVLVFLLASALHAAETPALPSIEVSGAADVMVVPDEIVIRLGVQTRDMSLEKAKKDNDERVRKVLATARDAHIEAKDIQTDYFSISLDYDYDDSKRDFRGYEVEVSIAIILHDVKQYDSVVTGAIQAGANLLHEVDFRTTALRKHRDRARQMALEAAREKAEAMARVLHRDIGKPLAIIENNYGSSSAVTQNRFVGGGLGGGGASSVESSTIALGQIKVSAAVTVRFELVDPKSLQP